MQYCDKHDSTRFIIFKQHQSSRTLEFVAPIMPNILKWAKIAVEEDHDDFIHWMFSKLHLVGIAPPEEFKDLLPEIVDLMLVSEKYNELFSK